MCGDRAPRHTVIPAERTGPRKARPDDKLHESRASALPFVPAKAGIQTFFFCVGSPLSRGRTEREARAATAPSLTTSQRSAARIVWRAPGSPVVEVKFRCSLKERGRAERRGRSQSSLRRLRRLVCSDPRASAPRDTEACRVVFSAASPPVPPASRARCLRLAPHDPRWADLSGFLAQLALRTKPYPPLWELTGALAV